MCFAKCTKCKSEIPALYDENGAFDEVEESQVIIPDDIHEHVDSVFENIDIEDGILGFIHETSYGLFFVCTSVEAQELCEYYASVYDSPMEF